MGTAGDRTQKENSMRRSCSGRWRQAATQEEQNQQGKVGWGGRGMLGMLREEEQLRGATFPFLAEGDDDGKPAPKKRLLFAVQALKLHAHLPENSCTCMALQAVSCLGRDLSMRGCVSLGKPSSGGRKPRGLLRGKKPSNVLRPLTRTPSV